MYQMNNDIHPAFSKALEIYGNTLNTLRTTPQQIINQMASTAGTDRWQLDFNQYLYRMYGNRVPDDYDLTQKIGDMVRSEANRLSSQQYGYWNQPQQQPWNQPPQFQPQQQQYWNQPQPWQQQPQFQSQQQPFWNQPQSGFMNQPQVYNPYLAQQQQQFQQNRNPYYPQPINGATSLNSALGRTPSLSQPQQQSWQQQPVQGIQAMQQMQQPVQPQVQPSAMRAPAVSEPVVVKVNLDDDESDFRIEEVEAKDSEDTKKKIGDRYLLESERKIVSDSAPDRILDELVVPPEGVPLEELADFNSMFCITLVEDDGREYVVKESTLGLLKIPYEEAKRLHAKCVEKYKEGKGSLDTEVISEINETLDSNGGAGRAFGDMIIKMFNEASDVCLQYVDEKENKFCKMPHVDSLDEIVALMKKEGLPDNLDAILNSRNYGSRLSMCIRKSYGEMFGRGDKTILDIKDKRIAYSVLNKLKARFTGYDTVGSNIYAAMRDGDDKVRKELSDKLSSVTPIAIPCTYLVTDELDVKDDTADHTHIPLNVNKVIRHVAKDKLLHWYNKRNKNWYKVGIGVDDKLALIKDAQ